MLFVTGLLWAGGFDQQLIKSRKFNLNDLYSNKRNFLVLFFSQLCQHFLPIVRNFFEKFDPKMLPCLSLQFIREYTAPRDLCYQMMFEKIRGLQLLVRKNEGLDAKQTVSSSNDYGQM